MRQWDGKSACFESMNCLYMMYKCIMSGSLWVYISVCLRNWMFSSYWIWHMLVQQSDKFTKLNTATCSQNRTAGSRCRWWTRPPACPSALASATPTQPNTPLCPTRLHPCYRNSLLVPVVEIYLMIEQNFRNITIDVKSAFISSLTIILPISDNLILHWVHSSSSLIQIFYGLYMT